MAPDRARHVDNIKTTDEHVDAYSCIRNVSVQTGEEFSPEFLRKPRLGLLTTNEGSYFGHVSSDLEGSYFGKLKFLCSFGGRILPRPSDGKLRYVGGITRIISVDKNLDYRELMMKTFTVWNQPHTIKYQLPDEDLDVLISVCSNDDFHHLIEEYNEIENGSLRLCVFLVPLNERASPSSYDSVSQTSSSDYEYVIAVNGMTGFSLK